jgi:hypothetical protein
MLPATQMSPRTESSDSQSAHYDHWNRILAKIDLDEVIYDIDRLLLRAALEGRVDVMRVLNVIRTRNDYIAIDPLDDLMFDVFVHAPAETWDLLPPQMGSEHRSIYDAHLLASRAWELLYVVDRGELWRLTRSTANARIELGPTAIEAVLSIATDMGSLRTLQQLDRAQPRIYQYAQVVHRGIYPIPIHSDVEAIDACVQWLRAHDIEVHQRS